MDKKTALTFFMKMYYIKNPEIGGKNKSLKILPVVVLETKSHFSKAEMEVLPNEISTKHVEIESHKLQTSLSIY